MEVNRSVPYNIEAETYVLGSAFLDNRLVSGYVGKLTEDDFFDNIYSAHNIKRVEATRMINCNSEARGKIKELLISNF